MTTITSTTSTPTPTTMTTTTTTNHDNASVYTDLIQFLQSPREDLRQAATEAVWQVRQPCEVLQLMQHGIVRPLLKIVSNTTNHPQLAQKALQTLWLWMNMESLTNRWVEELLEHQAVPRLVELVLSITTTNNNNINDESSSMLIHGALALLANLTRTERGTLELVGTTLPDHAVVVKTNQGEDDNDTSSTTTTTTRPKRPTMELLLHRFFNPEWISSSAADVDYSQLEPDEWDTLTYDPYQHFAAILMNATQVAAGRAFVLQLKYNQKDNNNNNDDDKKSPSSSSVLQQLIPQLQSLNPIRRRGIAGMIRNCCMDTDSAWWMIHVVKILTPLLFPLAGPEPLDLDDKQGMDPDLWMAGPDKVREIDGTTRLYLVESILLLCASGRKSRESIRLAKTYVILKHADMVEELESVSERINECVQYLRRDEEGTDEGSSDRFVQQQAGSSSSHNNKWKALPASSTASSVVANPYAGDYDDVD